jgi:P27 family predicted phage terminase small subunit
MRRALGPYKDPQSEHTRALDQAAKRRGEIVPPRSVVVVGHPATAPVPPADFGEVALAVWREAWACPWMHESDRSAVQHLCTLESERHEMSRVVAEQGLTHSRPVVSPRGEQLGTELLANPLLRAISGVDKRIGEVRSSLGLTPVSRSRLGLVVAEAESTVLESLMRRREANGERARA